MRKLRIKQIHNLWHLQEKRFLFFWVTIKVGSLEEMVRTMELYELDEINAGWDRVVASMKKEDEDGTL